MALLSPKDPMRWKVQRFTLVWFDPVVTSAVPSYSSDFDCARFCASVTICRASWPSTLAAANNKHATDLFIFERLDQRSAHGSFTGRDRRKKRDSQNYRQKRQCDLIRILVAEMQPGDVFGDNFQTEIQLEGAEGESKNQSDGRDGKRFEPNRLPDLVAQSAHGLQHAELAAPVRDRNRQCINDPEYRDENSNRDLDVSDTEPLIRQFQNVLAHAAVRENKQTPLGAKFFENASLHIGLGRARREIKPENVDRVVAPVAPVQATIDEDAALLIRIVGHDPGDRQMQNSVRTRNVHDVTDFEAAQQREVLRRKNPASLGSFAIHRFRIARDHGRFGVAH